MDALLLFVDISRLMTEGGLPPDECLVDPRAGGGAGRDIEDGDVNGGEEGSCKIPLMEAGRRDGGGGGALPLPDLGLPPASASDIDIVSSSTFGESLPELLLFSLESEIIWLRRRAIGGTGGVFLRIDEDGEGGSGVFPAASLSNTDSLSDSWLARFGAGGSGLLRSV